MQQLQNVGNELLVWNKKFRHIIYSRAYHIWLHHLIKCWLADFYNQSHW